MKDKAKDAMWIDELTTSIHRTDPVGVAVGREAGMSIAVLHDRCQQAQVPGNRLRVDATKAGVHLIPQIKDIGSGSHQHFADRPSSRAIHGIMDDTQFSCVNDVEINQRPQMLILGPRGVERHDLVGADGVFESHQARFAGGRCVLFQKSFYPTMLFGAGAATV